MMTGLCKSGMHSKCSGNTHKMAGGGKCGCPCHTGVQAGGPGSGRKPSGVSKEVHETLTKYGYKHTAGEVDPSWRNAAVYRHPDGHSVGVDRSRGVSDWSVHPAQGREGPSGVKMRAPGGHATPVGPYAGSGQDTERLGKVLSNVQTGKPALQWKSITS
jgi:hypothetical protein